MNLPIRMMAHAARKRNAPLGMGTVMVVNADQQVSNVAQTIVNTINMASHRILTVVDLLVRPKHI